MEAICLRARTTLSLSPCRLVKTNPGVRSKSQAPRSAKTNGKRTTKPGSSRLLTSEGRAREIGVSNRSRTLTLGGKSNGVDVDVGSSNIVSLVLHVLVLSNPLLSGSRGSADGLPDSKRERRCDHVSDEIQTFKGCQRPVIRPPLIDLT